MTPKQMALSQLARLALNAVSDSSPVAKAETCQLVSAALRDDCPDLAQLAAQASLQFSKATEAEADLLSHLRP
jgi:hypothetical protein